MMHPLQNVANAPKTNGTMVNAPNTDNLFFERSPMNKMIMNNARNVNIQTISHKYDEIKLFAILISLKHN